MRMACVLVSLLVATTACEVENKLYSTECYEPCYTGPPETEGVGQCIAGTPVCENRRWTGICDGEILPEAEHCDLIDNDCNGTIDDEVTDTGVGEFCGVPFGTCSFGTMQCVDGLIDCHDAIWPEDETCDGLDNDCNGIIDDMDSIGYCYDGDDDDLYYGECHAGILVCEMGEEVCENQQLPEEEVCDGLDNDCDGFVDEDLDEGDHVDIVFVLDRSGSMSSHFMSVANASQLFAASFTGVPEFRFALVGIPPEGSPSDRGVEVILDFTDASTFVAQLSLMTTTSGGSEASWDAPYQAADGTLGLSWGSIDVRKYIVLFTDERGQSYTDPDIDEMDVATLLMTENITFYGFIKSTFWTSFDDIADLTGGSLYNLGSEEQMEEDLSEIFSDECW